jgi:large subunit ribosomal protein L1
MMGDVGSSADPRARGLMPNPKSGTVTFDVTRAVKDVKAGKIEFRTDKTGKRPGAVGRRSFTRRQLAENIRAFMDTIVRASRRRPRAVRAEHRDLGNA